MARICWDRYDLAYYELTLHNAMSGLRKNTSERWF
jgi:hypothetical protein